MSELHRHTSECVSWMPVQYSNNAESSEALKSSRVPSNFRALPPIEVSAEVVMMDVLEATRNVTEPARQCRYVNGLSGAAGRSAAPPVSSCTITCASALAVSGQRGFPGCSVRKGLKLYSRKL